MLNAIESWLMQSHVNAYPGEWWASKHIVTIGKRIVQYRADYRFDKHLLLTKHPTIIDRIRAGFAYARYMTLQGHNALIEVSADALFINCYFLQKKDATAFASAIHFPRYLVALIKRSWQEAYSLIRHQTSSGTSTYLLMAITLEVFFHAEIGEWIQTEDIDLAPPTEEELGQA
jgi:hypothetical protein